MNRAKVAVGLSGGVDSAVSALLLKRQGFDVMGVHLYCWPPESEVLGQSEKNLSSEERSKIRAEWIKKNGCRADDDRQFALKTAMELEIPFKVLDFSEEYNQRVVNYFYREYENGRTPNPDVLCNSEIKFGLFLDWAIKNGFDYIATGHYSKLEDKNGRLKLGIPTDKRKDQTYFLWKLTQKELEHILFPLGDLNKYEVRNLAKNSGLSVADRKDSQGICFVGNVEAREFLSRRLKIVKGDVKNISGEIVGTHDGVWFYTIGQRGGWRMDSRFQKRENNRNRKQNESMGGDFTPVYYVVSKDAQKNELVVGVGSETKSGEFSISEVNWIDDPNLVRFVRIRHGGSLIPCLMSERKVRLSEQQSGIAPGQSAVFYSDDGLLVGGGVIE